MYNKSSLATIIVFLLVLSFGCSDPTINEGTGTLIVQIPAKSRSLPVYTPDLPMENVAFSISGTGPSNASISSEIFMSSVKEFNDLPVGIWEITISGYNSEEKKISSCTFQTTIRKNQVTTKVVKLIPVIGTGVLDFYIDWEDPSGIMIAPQIQLSLESVEDLIDMKTVQVSQTSSKVASSDILLDSGWYLVTASLFEGSSTGSENSPWWQGIFSLRIVEGETTSVIMSIPEKDITHRGTGVSDIIIQEDMKSNFSVSYSGNLENILPNDTIMLSASTDHSNAAQYRWYVNGELQVGMNDRYLNYQFLAPGRFTIALFVIDNGVVSGYNKLFTVINPIPVSKVIIDQRDLVTEATGLSVQLSASLFPEDATNKDIIWSSNDRSIADVDQNGLLVFKKEGNAIITATAIGGTNISDSCDVSSAYLNIGDTGQAGGKVFYIDSEDVYPNWTYLEIAPYESYIELPWGYDATVVTETELAFASGAANTKRIIAYFGNSFSHFGYDNYAAKYCDEYSFNGYEDWFLPSLNELKALSKHSYALGLWGLGNGGASPAWSSSADTMSNAHMCHLVGGTSYSWGRWNTCLVLPIRKY